MLVFLGVGRRLVLDGVLAGTTVKHHGRWLGLINDWLIGRTPIESVVDHAGHQRQSTIVYSIHSGSSNRSDQDI